MKIAAIGRIIPSWKNALLALLAAALLILAFPDFDLWWTAWFALVPLMFAVEREKASTVRSFVLGWIFGTIFFFGTCWWLTFAPITYAGFPPLLAYGLMLIVAVMVGVFPAIFAAILSAMLRNLGSWAFFAAPFVWVFTEFLRYWITGNNWNAIGYSQAFGEFGIRAAGIGGVLLVSWMCIVGNCALFSVINGLSYSFLPSRRRVGFVIVVSLFGLLCVINPVLWLTAMVNGSAISSSTDAVIVAVQPNVPMSNLTSNSLLNLRESQAGSAEAAKMEYLGRRENRGGDPHPILVVFPESPMNFMYNDDREFQQFIGDFARRNNVSVLFNSAEPDKGTIKYFNSAVMVGPDGKEVAEYDKIYLLPFGEAVPPPFEGILPGFVGNFSYGREYDILPVGDAKAGVMICFESHFGQLSRRYVQDGADVIIEMTNDGYLGPTPVLRQHLANAVFRAVETNRPVLRVTNVGVTAYINERGEVLDQAPTYAEATRVWSVSKSDGSQTFYVRYGDWFAWLCSVATVLLLIFALATRRRLAASPTATNIKA